ncbi:hypothetical protein WR25_08125 [Diploscapter pachys]|uniref:NADH dehydrogenase [ubiquinone] 1 beta subcomplex subunit 8, mitochondrial n=1 Tax=Diploscapter pachys TaxID=2018661 RepID=A0A2A2JKQ9_9BILA|nr:hypothetical protein WR25_08125 [Diploscapter pachys]
MLTPNPWAIRAARYYSVSRVLHARGPLTFPGWYPRDHKPGPYPETNEERRAAAIKYGMRPEDYQPIDKNDVVRYCGDYPELGSISYDHKDPYESWTDPVFRRNWGEMVDIEMIRYRPDRYTYTGLESEDFSWWGALKISARVLVPMALLAWWVLHSDHPNRLRWKNPAMPKQYSHDYYRAWPYGDPRNYPIVNYSFELEDE